MADRQINWVEARHNKEQEIEAKAPGLWAIFWEEITASYTVYRKYYDASGRVVKTNGSYVTTFSKPGKNTAGTETLTIRLEREEFPFKVAFGESAHLVFDVTPEGAVSLFHDNKPVTPQDASRMILEPFLFG